MTDKARTVSDATNEAGREFLALLAEDFDDPELKGSDIVAAWGTNGILIICCRGPKAETLDAVLRDRKLAIPGGTAPGTMPEPAEDTNG